MFLGAAYLFLTVRDILNRANLMAGRQAASRDLMDAWSTLNLRVKLQFFNYWVVLSIVGNLFQIFGGVLTLLDNETYITTHQVLIGFGCFFAWVGIVRFIDHRSVGYSIVHTLERSIKIIAYYVFGVVPIFMGFAFLGICFFWQTGIYYSTPMSLIANYALVNGDSVYAFSYAGYQQNKFFGQLYFYMFIVFFICCVHNLFIAIVEQSFSSFREERMNAKSSSSDEEPLSPGMMSPKIRKSQEEKEKSNH
jgi:hypothetical protein